MVSRRAFMTSAGVATGLALAGAAVGCGIASSGGSGGGPSSARLKVSIMVGGLNKIIYLPAMLTKQLGHVEEQNLQLDLLDEPSGVSAEDAMLAGQVNGVVGFYDHCIDLQGVGKRCLSVVQLNGVPGEVELVSSKKADEIKSPADFKGRNLGVTGLGSSTNFLTQFLATKAGLKLSDINSVAVGAGNTFIAAMQQGTIDAGMTTEPTISRMLKSGEAKVLVDMRTPETTRAALGVDYPAACLYMQADWANGHQEEVQRLANAFVKTLSWIHSHSAAEVADKMPQDYYAGDKELYLQALSTSLPMFTTDGKMPPQGPAGVLQVLSAFDKNVQGKQIELQATYTTEFVDKVK